MVTASWTACFTELFESNCFVQCVADDVVIPPSPTGDAADEAPADEAPDPTTSETPVKQKHDKLRTLAGDFQRKFLNEVT